MSTTQATTSSRFAEALRPRLMGPRLGAALGDGHEPCHVLDAKYEPGVRAVILYDCGGRLVRGDLLPLAEGHPGHADGADGTHGSGSLVSPGVRIHAFPQDPDLPSLPQVMHGGPRRRTWLLRYRPGRRATVLVASGQGDAARVAKVYHDPAKAAAVAEEGPLLSAAAGSQQVLRFAPTVAHVPSLSLVVHRAVTGTPLDALVGNPRGSAARSWGAVLLAARALAEMHTLPGVSRRSRPAERELQRFLLRAGLAGTVDPRLGSALTELAERLQDLHAGLPAARTGLVHGDCKPSQFLVTDRRVHLLDLDHCGVADQAGDVGTFLASLTQLATRHGLAHRAATLTADLTALGDLFLEAYLESSDGDGLRPRVTWQQAAALERKALRAFARAPGSPLAGALVEEAHRCLDRLTAQ